MGKKTSVYLPDDLAADVAASGKSIAELIRAGLDAEAKRDRLAAATEELARAIGGGYRLVPRDE